MTLINGKHYEPEVPRQYVKKKDALCEELVDRAFNAIDQDKDGKISLEAIQTR